MKKTAILLALLLGIISTARAQTTALTAEDTWKDIKLGPFVSAGEAVSAGTVAIGAKTGSAFAFSAGADADFPLNPNISFNLALGYDARGINFHDQSTTSNEADYTFGYFVLRPEFRFSGFLLGVGVGIPVSASVTNTGSVSPETPVTSSSMATLFEIRLGGAIPIVQSSTGVLNLTIDAAYAFTQIVSKGPLAFYPSTASNIPSSQNNGPLASAELGFQYLFDLTPH
jgi:hypothetical protein